MLFQQELKGDVNQHETTISEYNFGVAPRVHCHLGGSFWLCQWLRVGLPEVRFLPV